VIESVPVQHPWLSHTIRHPWLSRASFGTDNAPCSVPADARPGFDLGAPMTYYDHGECLNLPVLDFDSNKLTGMLALQTAEEGGFIVWVHVTMGWGESVVYKNKPTRHI
jgi:hypothetical protein